MTVRHVVACWFALASGLAAATALADLGDCGQPITAGAGPSASDALFTLQAAVGNGSCEPAVCDVDGTCTVTAVDALRILRYAVQLPEILDCELCGSSSTTTSTLMSSNQAPVVSPANVYRTYPDYPIEHAVDAQDPDGNGLSYAPSAVPDGCSLDTVTGVLTWTPTAQQVDAHYVAVTVTDDGVPPRATEAVLPVKVLPPDACVDPLCDPATGCESVPVPLDQPCCTAEPVVRVAEPDATCPEGRVLFVGRNNVGFGRMQNCDLLQIIPFAQGGINTRFHIETRCIDTSEPVTVEVRLSTVADGQIVGRIHGVELQERNDGYAQRLALVYALRRVTDPAALEGAEARLYVKVTDQGGAIAERTLRVVLTRDDLGDLPNPDIEDIPAGEAGCVGCHRPLTGEGERVGIEDAHPWFSLTCVDCHGGDASASTRAGAHVSSGDGPQFLKSLASDELDDVPLDYLRFVNPGDLRAAADSCGPVGCHPDQVAAVSLSTMSTYGGHYTLPRYLAGIQDRTPIYGAVDVAHPDFDPGDAPEGAVEMLEALRGPHALSQRGSMESVIDEYLPKSCPTCHLGAFGRNQAAGTYRSSGCTACHMVYADDGLSRSADPVVQKNFPPHPVAHRLTSAIPTEQCTHCHFQGGRVGLAYRGIREGGFPPARTPPDAVSLGEPLYGHDADFYFSDEDGTNGVDETPPDLHFDAGMVCADCHVGGDVHGDGNLYSAERYQVGIRCEDCHGTVRQAITEDPADGLFKNSKGFALRRLRRTESGAIMMAMATQARELDVPQVERIIAAGTNPLMNVAMGVYSDGYSHTDSLECYTCHTSWRQNCFGCHITVDDRGTARNETTGKTTLGAASAVREDYSLDFFALGMDSNGKLAPLCSSMSIFVNYIDAAGSAGLDEVPRTSSDGKKGFGWNPFHHHTVSKIPQNCDRCHPVLPGAAPDNSEMLNATYGFGDGSILVEDGEGTVHDLTAFLDENGELIADFPHPGTGPVPADVRERAMAVQVVPHPR